MPVMDKNFKGIFFGGSGYNSKSKKASSSMSLEHLLRFMDFVMEKRIDLQLNDGETYDTFIEAFLQEMERQINECNFEKELKTYIFEYDNPEMARKLKYERELEEKLKVDPNYVDPDDIP